MTRTTLTVAALEQDVHSGGSDARITDSSFTKADNFSPHAQRNAFRRRSVRQQCRLFARWNPPLRRSPNSNRISLDYQRFLSRRAGGDAINASTY
jgi:hypothetical protein